MPTAKAVPRSKERCGAVSCCWPDCYAVVIVAAKPHVAYSARVGRYNCYGARTNHGMERCIPPGGLATDAAVVWRFCASCASLGIDAAVEALTAQQAEMFASRTKATRAGVAAGALSGRPCVVSTYDAVDPANRLVAGEPMLRRWNEALLAVQRIEGADRCHRGSGSPPLGELERQVLMRFPVPISTPLSHIWPRQPQYQKDPAGTALNRGSSC